MSSHENKTFRRKSVAKQKGMVFGFWKTATAVTRLERQKKKKDLQVSLIWVSSLHLCQCLFKITGFLHRTKSGVHVVNISLLVNSLDADGQYHATGLNVF